MTDETVFERLNDEARMRLSSEQIAEFEGLGQEEGIARMQSVADWLSRVNVQNHDGVRITPVLSALLTRTEEAEGTIGHLDGLREKTRHGQFDAGNELMRELEYHRFASECGRQRDWPDEPDEQRALFDSLTVHQEQQDDPAILTDEDVRETGRAAYEAVELLKFLQKFQAGTSRPVVVLGNERYGRDWVVQPLEPYLRDDFDIRYWRVQSHSSMRLTVPHWIGRWNRSGFPPEFWVEMSETQPHIFVVDECSPRRTEHYSKYARGVRDLVNWFMVFNDIRAQGDGSLYEAESTLPAHHFPELRKWHEYVITKRDMQHYVEPGATYRIRHWAPELKPEVLMGDMVVPSRPAEFGQDAPTVVLANPAIYRTNGDDLPEPLKGTRPYYFNDPEYRVREKIVPGFGAHGFETRVVGPTTDEYVIAARLQIEKEIAAMLDGTEQAG
ncbi:MAG: hypothetical protein F4W93_11860 [Dehalococcoidia bacterium]|nr:hypothetical protein [Dehalococcoidia bacterium]